MKKLALGILILFAHQSMQAQFDFKQNNDADVPILGWQMGAVAGGFTAMLPNRDDLNADARIDPQTTNFSYAFGIERIYWFQPSIGFGAQLLYWQGGAAYKGYDSIAKTDLNGTAKMNYLKLPFLFHYKSFNRYHPNRRVRFTSSFGPYVALLTSFKETFTYTKQSDKNFKEEFTFDNLNYSGISGQKGKLNGKIYNPFDLGIVFSLGGEMRLGRRSVLSVQLRTDVGITNIENTKLLQFKADNSSVETNFNVWDGYYAIFTAPNANEIAKGFEANRPATRNFSLGGFVSYKRYLTK